MIPFVGNIQNGRVRRRREELSGSGSRGAPRGVEVTAHRRGVPCWGDENVLKWAVVRAAQPCECTKNRLVMHFKWVNLKK